MPFFFWVQTNKTNNQTSKVDEFFPLTAALQLSHNVGSFMPLSTEMSVWQNGLEQQQEYLSAHED